MPPYPTCISLKEVKWELSVKQRERVRQQGDISSLGNRADDMAGSDVQETRAER